MNRHLFKLLYPLILLLLTGCAASTVNRAEKEGATALDIQSIFDITSENTLRLVSSDFDAYLYFGEDGSLSAKSIFNNNQDYGSWDIKSDSTLCIRFNVWYYGDTKCYSAYREADKKQYLFFTENGALAYTATPSSGNAQAMKIKSKKENKAVFVRSSMTKSKGTERPSSSSAAEKQASEQSSIVTSSGSGSSREEAQQTVKSMAQNCPDCNFEDADLRKAHLVGANLKGANLRGADLSRANLRRANLEGADLSGATLLSANLPGANLKGADLSGADLTGSNLIKADFSGADMTGSILDKTLQEGARGLK